MTTRFDALTQPVSVSDYKATTRHRDIGFIVATIGLMLAVVTLIANISAANNADPASAAETLAWSFGLTTLAFGTIKFAIAIILVGILIRLWVRVESVKVALAGLKPAGDGQVQTGNIKTAYGAATASATVPKSLQIHKMARTMWAPMVAMGAMLLVAGTIVSFVWSANVGTRTGSGAQAWTAGLQKLRGTRPEQILPTPIALKMAQSPLATPTMKYLITPLAISFIKPLFRTMSYAWSTASSANRQPIRLRCFGPGVTAE